MYAAIDSSLQQVKNIGFDIGYIVAKDDQFLKYLVTASGMKSIVGLILSASSSKASNSLGGRVLAARGAREVLRDWR